jgi:hypothetical protein
VGSHYLIAVAGVYDIILTDAKWRVLATIELHND